MAFQEYATMCSSWLPIIASSYLFYFQVLIDFFLDFWFFTILYKNLMCDGNGAAKFEHQKFDLGCTVI